MHDCKSWSQALDSASQKFDIVSWGRELESGRGPGIIRLSTPYFKDKYLRALLYALELGYEHITELSIHFSEAYSADLTGISQAPFSPEGCHGTYLNWIGMNKQSNAALVAKKSVYDRLATTTSSTLRDFYPKDNTKSVDISSLELASENKKRMQTISLFPKFLVRYLPLMQNLRLIAFYGMYPALIIKNTVKNILLAIARNSSTYRKLEGVIFRNCPLGDEVLKPAILNISTALSLRLLVLHTCNLTDDSAGALGAVLTAHKNLRDNKLWEMCLKDYGPTLKETASRRSGAEQLTRAQLQKLRCMHDLKGITYLDLGYNKFGNGLCTELLDSLKDDTYVHSISLDGNKDIKLTTSIMLPKYDNGDLDFIYDNIITLSKDTISNDTNKADGDTSKPDAEAKGEELHLPIRMSERIAQLDAFSNPSADTKSRAEQIVLQSICPDYEPSAKSTVLTYLASYSRTTDDLKTLMTLKAHPLVQLLLQNSTILHLLLDSSTTPTLLRFVNTRLSANRKIANTVLLNDADKALVHEKNVREAVEELREQENLQGMIKRLHLATDPINFLADEKPISLAYDKLTPRRRSRRGKSISHLMHLKHQVKNLDHLDDDIPDTRTPPVDKNAYPLQTFQRTQTPTQSRPQSASKMLRTTSAKRSMSLGTREMTSSECQAKVLPSYRNNIYYSNASSGFSNYAKGPMPFDTVKKTRRRACSTDRKVPHDDSDDLPAIRRNKPDPFASKAVQRRPASQKTTHSTNMNVVASMHATIDQAISSDRRAMRSAKGSAISGRSGSGRQRVMTPKQTSSSQQRIRSAAPPIKPIPSSSMHKEYHNSITSDDETKYDVIFSPKKPNSMVASSTKTSKSTSLVRLSQGIPTNGPLRTSPHTKKPTSYPGTNTYVNVDASALSEIEPVRTSTSPINKPDNYGSGIEHSDANDTVPTYPYESSRDSFSRALHNNIDTIRLEHYAPPVLTEPSSVYITKKDKDRVYKRLLEDIASSVQPSSDTNDTSTELRELSAKAHEIIRLSRLKNDATTNSTRYTFYPNENKSFPTDDLYIDELSHTVGTSNVLTSETYSRRADTSNIELNEIDQLLTKAQSMGEELDRSYKRINSLYAETMQDIYGTTTTRNEHSNINGPKQVDLDVINQLLINNSPPKPSSRPVVSLAEKLALSKTNTHSLVNTTDDELLRSVDSILGQPQVPQDSFQEGQSEGSKTTDLDISSVKESIRLSGNPALTAQIGECTFESIIGLLYTVLMYFTKSDRSEALRLYKDNESTILEYVEEILTKLRQNEIKLDDVSGCLYELVASLISE